MRRIVSSRKLLVSGINSENGNHNAGGLVFGPDRKLYISAGDGGRNPNLAQDLTALDGKILRINADGTVPADNPFTNRPEIWAYGLRNPWRFAFAPLTGLMIISQVVRQS
ncbi:MAG TPA: PQQ-dependent sugar dehydrogenase, partial [Acidobacteriota bacterium]|nr:PQQ-dependent sugar dehydrogenase [Acidobacteriota bacterium]